MTTTEAAEQVQRRKKVRRDRITAILLLVAVVFIPVVVMFVAPITLKVYDAAHQISVDCVVTSAHSGVNLSHSLKGVGSSTNRVVIETRDCGSLVFRWRVTSDNKDQIAANLSKGGRYTFQIGAGSYKLRDFLGTVRQAVYVKEYQKD